jgi:hypothetical protein
MSDDEQANDRPLDIDEGVVRDVLRAWDAEHIPPPSFDRDPSGGRTPWNVGCDLVDVFCNLRPYGNHGTLPHFHRSELRRFDAHTAVRPSWRSCPLVRVVRVDAAVAVTEDVGDVLMVVRRIAVFATEAKARQEYDRVFAEECSVAREALARQPEDVMLGAWTGPADRSVRPKPD